MLEKFPRGKVLMRGVLCWCIGIAGWAHTALAADFTAYTEDWPPYNYEEGGAVKGISTEVLQAACTLAKLQCEVHMVPWARGLRTVNETPNTVLYTTARKPSREKQFLWVGPIAPRTTWVYVRAALAPRIQNFDDLARHPIGVVREAADQQDLEAKGIPPGAFKVQNSNMDVLRMLREDSVDAMVDTEVGMAWSLRNATLPATAVVKRMKLSDGGGYYFALNLQSDPVRVQALQKAVDTLRRTGKLNAIVRKYTVR